MASPTRSYPFLLALVPVFHMVASNPGWSTLGDLAVITGTVLAGCGIVYALAALVSRGRWGGRLPPLAAPPAAAGHERRERIHDSTPGQHVP